MILSRLASFFGFSSVVDFGDLDLQLLGDLAEVHRPQQLANRLGADQGGEGILAVLILRAQILVLVQELALLERGETCIDDDVGLEIENALEILQRHIEQKADARGQRLQEPDMRHRRRERNIAHALAPHARKRDLDAALLADDALVLHPLVLAAQALVVLDRPEDARAEQTVTFRLEGPVVDRLGLFDFAERPRQNLLGAGDRNLDLVEGLRRHNRAEEIRDLLIHRLLLIYPRGLSPDRGRISFKRSTLCLARHREEPRDEATRNIAGSLRLVRNDLAYSAASAGGSSSGAGFGVVVSSTLRPSERISLTRTLKLSGMPDSNASSPRTIDS